MPSRRYPASKRADDLRSVDAVARQAGRQARRRAVGHSIEAPVSAPSDPMCAERILVALGTLREASAVTVCKALGLDPCSGDFVTLCKRLGNMYALGQVKRYRRDYSRDRLYALTATGCELAMLVMPSGEAPADRRSA